MWRRTDRVHTLWAGKIWTCWSAQIKRCSRAFQRRAQKPSRPVKHKFNRRKVHILEHYRDLIWWQRYVLSSFKIFNICNLYIFKLTCASRNWWFHDHYAVTLDQLVPCCPIQANNFTCIPFNNNICPNRQLSIFFDNVHPTEVANVPVAARYYTAQNPTDKHPFDIQELAQLQIWLLSELIYVYLLVRHNKTRLTAVDIPNKDEAIGSFYNCQTQHNISSKQKT